MIRCRRNALRLYVHQITTKTFKQKNFPNPFIYTIQKQQFMDHKNIALFFGLLLPIFAIAQLPTYPLPYKTSDYASYKGLASCTEYKLEDLKSEPQPNQATQVWYYNENGLPITQCFLAPSEEDWEKVDTIETCWLTYNDKGWLTRKRSESADYGEIISAFTYNKKGVLTKKETACIDPPTETYIYDKKGLLKEVKMTQRFPTYDDEGEMNGTADPLTYRYVYTTNDKGQIIGEVHYAVLQGEEPAASMKREFNDKGLITRWVGLGSDGTPYADCVYSYDEKGRLVTMVQTQFEEVSYYVYVYK